MFNGNKLQQLRKKKKINQKELAADLNINQVSISKYELGKQQPSIENLEHIADYFNVSIDYLMDRIDDKETLDLHLQAIINELNKLDALDRIDIYSLVLQLVKSFTRRKNEPSQDNNNPEKPL
jgi:transcriptional regulator with XRE-family HTH domain